MKQKFDLKLILKNEKVRFSVLFLSLGVISFLVSNSSSNEKPHRQEFIELDSLIPNGYVLLPLDLVNREALSSIMAATAVVDLFTVNSQTLNPSKKIASRVKILRTPRNPEQFAILVKEAETAGILQNSGPYFAVIQNKFQNGSRVLLKSKAQTVEISYQE